MNKAVIITVGLPGCGKSTAAREIKNMVDDTVIIERDEIRNELYDIFRSVDAVKEYYSSPDLRNKENEVTKKWMASFYEAHDEDYAVIILADTFMDPKRLEMIVDQTEAMGRDCLVMDFTSLPIEEVKKRNKRRAPAKIVDEKIIDKMAKRINSVRKKIEELSSVNRVVHIRRG